MTLRRHLAIILCLGEATILAGIRTTGYSLEDLGDVPPSTQPSPDRPEMARRSALEGDLLKVEQHTETALSSLLEKAHLRVRVHRATSAVSAWLGRQSINLRYIWMLAGAGFLSMMAFLALRSFSHQGSFAIEHDPKIDGDGDEWRSARVILGRYQMFMADRDVLGEGPRSIIRRGIMLSTGQEVAIKTFRRVSPDDEFSAATLTHFVRYVNLLKDLQKPWQRPKDPTLWNEELERASPKDLFVEMLDHSVTVEGEPGPDVKDGELYMVMEMAQYSLKDFVDEHRQEQSWLPEHSVCDLAKMVVRAAAGLNAKGYVHSDLRPENFRICGTYLKLSDLSSCLKALGQIDACDPAASFSPCYCSPEWAALAISDEQAKCQIVPAFDSWSVGMTLMELVVLEIVWRPYYAAFSRKGRSEPEACYLFLEWLSKLDRPPLPQAVRTFDKGFLKLLEEGLLVCDPRRRPTCAQLLSAPYFQDEDGTMGHADAMQQDVGCLQLVAFEPRSFADRHDGENEEPLVKGIVWKANAIADDPESQWAQREMWLSANHSLCYHSVQEKKGVIWIDGKSLASAEINLLPTAGMQNAWEIKLHPDRSEGAFAVVHKLACKTEEERTMWVQTLTRHRSECAVALHGDQWKTAIAGLRSTLGASRAKADRARSEELAPAFRSNLWKLTKTGDSKKPEDWNYLDVWISTNGSLVYWSDEEEREVLCYSAAELKRARVEAVEGGSTCHLYVFSVLLDFSALMRPRVAGRLKALTRGTLSAVQAPTVFATECKQHYERWMGELAKCV